MQHIQHTAGVYSFFAHLMHATVHHPGQSLCRWETGALCERRYRVNERWYNLRPDALADYAVEQRHILFWLEWDRGTMNVRDLTVKFTAYAQYLASREWAREQNTLPLLVCVVPDIAQEQRIMRVAQATLTQTSGLALYTTPIPLLKEYGPLAAIWSSVFGLKGDPGKRCSPGGRQTMTHPEEARRRDRARKYAPSAHEESEGTLALVCGSVVGRTMMAAAPCQHREGRPGCKPCVLVAHALDGDDSSLMVTYPLSKAASGVGMR